MTIDRARQSALTDASTVSRQQSMDTVPGMAHFAGTGPEGAVCGACIYWLPIPRFAKMHCGKFRQMVRKGAHLPIPSRTPACRYHEPRSPRKPKRPG